MAPDYITLNGRVFARNNRLATQTLFIPVNGSTASGTFKAAKDSIYLHDMQGKRVAFINAHGVCGQATKMDNGRYWYQYGDPPILGEWESLRDKAFEIHDVLTACGIN